MTWTVTTRHVYKEDRRRKGLSLIVGTNDSVAADLTDQVVLDKSAFVGANGTEPDSLVMRTITANVQGVTRLVLEFDGTSDTAIMAVGNGPFFADFSDPYSGLKGDATGTTGDVVASTQAAGAYASFTLIIEWEITGG